jgi:transposase-like protein
LLGKDAPGLSPTAIVRLKEGWLEEYAAWQKRDLSAKRYVYVWADGVYLQARLEDEKQCILVFLKRRIRPVLPYAIGRQRRPSRMSS